MICNFEKDGMEIGNLEFINYDISKMYRIYFLLISKCGLRKRVRIGLIEPRKLCMKQSNIFEKKMKSKFPMSIESETQRPKNWFTVYEE